ILNLTPTFARDESNATEEDKKAAQWADVFFNRSYLDPMVGGFFTPQLVEFLQKNDLCPMATEDEKKFILSQKIDFLGLNYYVPRRVVARTTPVATGEELMPQAFYEPYKAQHGRFNPYRSFDEVYPKAIYNMAMEVKKSYGNIKWYIAELGIAMNLEAEGEPQADGLIDDSFRTELFKEHLVELHKAITDGSNCFGVHQWTFIDNWSWLNSFKRRYGFYRLDLNTGNRIMKKHALFFKEMAKNNGF
ncbi:MAG: family 1 glycosylhydrolase, partial [Alphaproteobacteria bacterium]|nr:family 1 glycosylhydrolase [Alphaproteobacteria bacterium]